MSPAARLNQAFHVASVAGVTCVCERERECVGVGVGAGAAVAHAAPGVLASLALRCAVPVREWDPSWAALPTQHTPAPGRGPRPSPRRLAVRSQTSAPACPLAAAAAAPPATRARRSSARSGAACVCWRLLPAAWLCRCQPQGVGWRMQRGTCAVLCCAVLCCAPVCVQQQGFTARRGGLSFTPRPSLALQSDVHDDASQAHKLRVLSVAPIDSRYLCTRLQLALTRRHNTTTMQLSTQRTLAGSSAAVRSAPGPTRALLVQSRPRLCRNSRCHSYAPMLSAVCAPSPARQQPGSDRGGRLLCRASVPVAEPGKTTLGFCGIGIMGLPMVNVGR
jgi:hypothetical protein